MKSVLLLLRPHRWMKNLFIFLPLFFDGHLFEWDYLYPTFIAFLSYNFMASATYCFNDIARSNDYFEIYITGKLPVHD